MLVQNFHQVATAGPAFKNNYKFVYLHDASSKSIVASALSLSANRSKEFLQVIHTAFALTGRVLDGTKLSPVFCGCVPRIIKIKLW